MLACELYSLEHSIVYNPKKNTVVVCRNKAMMNAIRPSFIVNGDVISESDKVKCLGHIICTDLSDYEDMMRHRRHLLCSRECYFTKFPYVFNRCTLFRTFFTPMYTCNLWWNFTAQSFHMKVAFNNDFRMMHTLHRGYCTTVVPVKCLLSSG